MEGEPPERGNEVLVLKAILIKKFLRFDDPMLITNDIIKMWLTYPFIKFL